MTIEEIKNGETSHLEFKREIPERKESFLKTVSAFSNTSGGKIIFGIDDKTLEVVGIEGDVFKLLDSVINSISDNIEPLISPNINVESIENKTVIVLEIFPTNHTPCFLKSKGKENGTFIRVGATSRIADFYSLRELELNGIRSSFDSQKCVNLMNDKNHFNSEITQKLCSGIQKRMEKAGVQNVNVNEQTQIAIYDDRVEIISPGRLVAGLSLESALNGKSVARNPILAKVFRLMNLMEEWGSGFRRINQECENAKINLPKFQENELDCSIFFERKNDNKISEEEKSSVKNDPINDPINLFDLIKQNPDGSYEDYAHFLNISPATVKRKIAELKADGKIVREGANKNGKWKICD